MGKESFLEDLGRISTLGYIEKCWTAATASLNSNYISGKGAAFDSMDICTLGDYMKNYDPLKLKNWSPELNDSNKLARTYVVRITLPYPVNENESPIADLIIDSKGQDIALITKDKEGKELNFKIDSKLEKNIRLMTQGVEKEMGPEYAKEFLPRNVEELAKKISKDKLIPKNQEEVDKRKNSALGNFENSEMDGQDKENEEELSEDIKDRISKDTGRDISGIKRVVTVEDATSLNIGNGIDDEINCTESGEKVTIVEFKSGNSLNSEIVLVQGEKIIDDRRFDTKITDRVSEIDAREVQELEEKETSSITYTGTDGKQRTIELIENANANTGAKQICEQQLERNELEIQKVMAYESENKHLLEILREQRIKILCDNGFAMDSTVNKIEDQNLEEQKKTDEHQQEENDGYDPQDPNYKREGNFF